MGNVFKKIGLFFLSFVLLFKLSFAEGFLQDKFIELFGSISKILETPQAVIGLVFLFLFFGIYAFFLGFIRVIFSKNKNSSHGEKEIRVISAMLSFITSAGLFFIFKNSPELFLVFFGGFFGLFFVSFISFIISKYFFKYANNFKKNKVENDNNKKNAANVFYWFFVVLGLLMSVFLLVGYSSIVLSQVSTNGNCIYKDSDNNYLVKDYKSSSCQPFFLFTKIYNIGQEILNWLILIFIILGFLSLLGLFKKKDEAVLDKDVNTAKMLIISINKLVKKLNEDFKNKSDNISNENFLEAIKLNSSIKSKLDALKNDILNLQKIENIDRNKLKDSFKFNPEIFGISSNSFLDKLDRFISFNDESIKLIDELKEVLDKEEVAFKSNKFNDLGNLFKNSLELWEKIRNNLGYLRGEIENISLNNSIYNLESSKKNSTTLINSAKIDNIFKEILKRFILNKYKSLLNNNESLNQFINFNKLAVPSILNLFESLKLNQNENHNELFKKDLIIYLEHVYSSNNFSQKEIEKIITKDYKSDILKNLNLIQESIIKNKNFIEIYNSNWIDLSSQNNNPKTPPPNGGPRGSNNSSNSNNASKPNSSTSINLNNSNNFTNSNNSNNSSLKKITKTINRLIDKRLVEFSIGFGEDQVKPFYININGKTKYSGNSYYIYYSRDELGLSNGTGKVDVVYIYNNKTYRTIFDISNDSNSYCVYFN